MRLCLMFRKKTDLCSAAGGLMIAGNKNVIEFAEHLCPFEK